MKINIGFTENLWDCPGAEVVMLLPGSPIPDMDVLRSFARTQGAAVITPPFAHEGQRVMACITPEQTVLQPMCFPDDDTVSPGENVVPIAFPWGKLALCCEADVFQPQYARLAALKGCTLMAAAFPWTETELVMAGPWSVCQANCLPIALAQPEGGQMILPCPMTEDRSGFGRSSFDTDELPAAYREFPVFDSLNRGFYSRYREVLEK